MADFSVRPAKEYDLPAMNEIAWAAKSHWGYPEEWMKVWKEDLTLAPEHLDQMRVDVVEHQDSVIAWVAWEFHESYWEVEHLWVHPEHHCKGLGRLLFSHGFKKYVPSGSEIRVVADPNAIPFYEKLGFRSFKQLPSKIPGRLLPLMRIPSSSIQEHL